MKKEKESDFFEELEKITNRTFLLPTLNKTITYKRLDLIESSINKSIPNFIASRIMESMKNSIGGKKSNLIDGIDVKDEDIKDLLVSATEAWKNKVISPKLSDEQILDVPSEDRLAWFLNAVYENQESQVEGGGVINAEEVATFPDKRGNKRNSKRSANS